MLYLHVHGDDAAIVRALQVAEGYGVYWRVELICFCMAQRKRGEKTRP